MLFCLQASQTREMAALQLKLDTLIAAIGPARNELIASEELDPQSLEDMRDAVRREARE
jgi:low affinity Fe/Cu permease